MSEASDRPTATTPLLESPARLAMKILSDDDVLRLHEAALKLLGAGGPAAEAAAAAAPGSFALGGRALGHDVTLGAGLCWLGTGGCATQVRPLAGGDPAPATAGDLDTLCRLADALPQVGLVCAPPVRCAEMPGLVALSRCFAGTSKHLRITTLRSAAAAEAAAAMATAVAGSEPGRRALPPLSLCGGPETLPAAEVFARAGLPVAVVAPPDVAPDGDLAATLARHHAGVLAACSAVQAAAPGASFAYLADPVKAGLPAGSPAADVFVIAAAQLAAHVGLPVTAATTTTSQEPGWQASAQGAISSLSATAARADLTTGAGTLGGDTFSAQQLVLDTETFSWNAHIAAGIPVDDEALALGAIAEVGVGGNYLGQRHTRRHMKEVWRPRLLDRSSWDAWVASGEEGSCEKASALAERLLAEHVVVPLAEGVRDELDDIIAKAGALAAGWTEDPEA